MKYRITLNEEQLRAIKDACELRFRIDLLQDYQLSDIIAQIDTDFSPENPKHEEIFNNYIEKRRHIQAIVEALFEIASPLAQRMSHGRTRDMQSLVCEDIWQCCRHEIWKNNLHKGDTGYSVDSRPPMQVSDQELPTIETLE